MDREAALYVAYAAVGFFTTFYLLVQDYGQGGALWYLFIAIPVNAFLGAIWPVYWLALHWIFG